MILVLTVTIPIFVVLFAGYYSARKGYIDKGGIKVMTSFVFYFTLPLMLFHSLANAPVAEELNYYFMLAYALAGLVVFAFGFAVARWVFGCTWAEQAVQGLAISFGHTVFMTIPIGAALYGDAVNLPIALLIAIEMGVIVPVAIVLLEMQKSQDGAKLKALVKGLKTALLNPIILSILLGISAALLEIKMPKMFDAIVALVRGATVPCALYAIGASLAGLPLAERMRETGFMVLAKLFVYPAVVLLFMQFVPDLDPRWRNIALIAAATPLGVSVYLIASSYNAYQARASTATLASVVLSVVTLSILVVLLG